MNTESPVADEPEYIPGITPCQLALGIVIFDAITLLIGAVGLRNMLKAAAAERAAAAVARAAAPALSKIERIVAVIADPAATKLQKAGSVFKIVNIIYKAGLLNAVFKAFVDALSWWQAAIYGVSGIAMIVAAFATDGVALVAELVILLAGTAFLIADAVIAVELCCSSAATEAELQEPTPPAPDVLNPYPFMPKIAIATASGNYLTAVKAGGIVLDNAPIDTNRTTIGPWEKFKLVPLDKASMTFALQTSNGQYVTAVNGGGFASPNNSDPLHTDATTVGSWETLTLVPQMDGSFAICTSAQNGYFLTAQNGGGLPANGFPVATDATSIGPDETFTLQPFV